MRKKVLTLSCLSTPIPIQGIVSVARRLHESDQLFWRYLKLIVYGRWPVVYVAIMTDEARPTDRVLWRRCCRIRWHLCCREEYLMDAECICHRPTMYRYFIWDSKGHCICILDPLLRGSAGTSESLQSLTAPGGLQSLVNMVSRHFGPRTLRTQDISAPSDWCRNIRTVPHQCRSVSRTLRHWCETVSSLDLQKTFFYNTL